MTIETLKNSREFQEKLQTVGDLSEVEALLADAGVSGTADELFASLLPKGDELSEESLEAVSGGGSILTWVRSMLSRGPFGGGGSMGGR